MKRALIIIGIVVIAGGVVAGGVWLRMRSAPAPAAPVVVPPGGGLPTPDGGGQGIAPTGQTPAPSLGTVGDLRLESKKPLLGYSIDGDGNIIGAQPDGAIVRVIKGDASVTGNAPIFSLRYASVSYDGGKVLVLGEEGVGTAASVFDASSSQWRSLGSVARAAWSPTDVRIAYVAPRSLGWSLFTVDTKSNASKPLTLVSFAHEGLFPAWVFPKKIFLYEKPSASTESSIFKFDTDKKTLTRIVQGKGAHATWDTEALRGVVFIANDRGGGSLSLVDSDGNIEKRLSFVTLPSKCAFETKMLEPQAGSAAQKKTTLVCAVPRDRRRFESAILPDSYYQKELLTEDSFYRVDLTTGAIAAIFDKESVSIDASDVRIKNNRVYFINRYDGLLYSIPAETAR